MAKVRCYSVYDRKTLVYLAPFYAPTDAAAVRTLSDSMADINSMLGRHPADYVLYFVGEWDDLRGLYEPAVATHVVDAITLVAPSAPPTLPLDLGAQDGTTLHADLTQATAENVAKLRRN